jgi:hypothetical protein
MAGGTNTETYENFRVRPQNMSVKILRAYALTLLDLSMQSSVHEANTAAHHFNVEKTMFHHQPNNTQNYNFSF